MTKRGSAEDATLRQAARKKRVYIKSVKESELLERDGFMNLRKLYKIVNDEKTAIDFLKQHELLHSRRPCPSGFAHDMKYQNEQKLWRCGSEKCGRKAFGVGAGTWFHNVHLPLTDAVAFMYFWAHEQATLKTCKRELNMSGKTFVDWSMFMREVCMWKLEKTKKKIGGPGLTVEIDESVFARRKYNVGRIVKEQWVLGGICRETRDVFMVCVPNRKGDTLRAEIVDWVEPGTRVITDKWKAYDQLQRQGWAHKSVNHTYNFVCPEDQSVHTQTVERLWRSAKERNKRQSGTHRHMLDTYIAEFLWRWSVQGEDPFFALLRDLAAFMPPKQVEFKGDTIIAPRTVLFPSCDDDHNIDDEDIPSDDEPVVEDDSLLMEAIDEEFEEVIIGL